MSDPTRTAGETLTALFDDPHRARQALRRLQEIGIPDAALRLSEDPGSAGGRSEIAVGTASLAADQVERARRVLAEGGAAGARGAAGGETSHEPRRVQPGFADAPPGYVPDPDYGEDLPEPRGRFEDQIDNLPGDAGSENGRARVTIISPKEA